VTARLAAALLLAPCSLLAQLELYVVQGGAESRVIDNYNIGAVEVGSSVDTVFRLRNPGTSAVELDTLSAAGAGFSLVSAPHLPVSVTAGAPLDLTVRFQPVAVGGHSAYLRVNGGSVLLLATGLAPPAVLLDNVALTPGSAVDFGSIQSGSSASRTLVLKNQNTDPVLVSQLAVGGTGFRGPIGAAAPVFLAPQQSVEFDVVWEPQAAGAAEGSLTVNHATYRLLGTATEPPFPKPQIVIQPETPGSGQQVRLSIRLAEPSPASGSGELRMEFVGPSDPGAGFLAPPGLSATFTVQRGEDMARFGASTEITFQTGTTAGTIIFTALLGAHTEQASLQLAAMPVAIDSASAVRRTGSLEVTVNGFDNSRTAGPLVFTFLDRSGQVLVPIRVDGAAAFAQHFETANAGGLFALRAVFPVTGNASVVDSVDVELVNAVGTARRNVKMTE
jgi:hypothetical protein